MAAQGSDEETPDQSLGSFSLLNATGELLDDIQVNLERMYTESPAQTSSLSGSDGAGGSTTVSVNSLTIRKTRMLPTDESVDPENFDRLSMIDTEEVIDRIDSVDWLVAPTAPLSPGFNEDDRSFLDTNLLNKRFSLLNYVTRVINEERLAETRNTSSSNLDDSNLTDEVAGSGATIRINRSLGRPRLDRIIGATVVQNGFTSGHDTNGHSSTESNPTAHSDFRDTDSSVCSTNGSSPQASGGFMGRKSDSETGLEISENQSNYNTRRSSDSDGSPMGPRQLNYDMTANLRTPEARNLTPYLADESSVASDNDRNETIPENVSPIARIPFTGLSTGTFKLTPRSFGNVRIPINERIDSETDPLNSKHGDYASNSSGSFSREIDTRTYTRPKKSRMTIVSSRQLNTTMENSPGSNASTLEGGSPHPQLNSTINMSPLRQLKAMGETSARQLNTTINVSPQRHVRGQGDSPSRHLLNTTIDVSPERTQVSGAAATSALNLNETFVADNEESQYESTGDRARRVTRNLSYVIKRDEESPNNNSSHNVSNSSRSELNNTFTYDPDADIDSPAARGSQNTSMEDLNSRVASQIRSLGCSSSIPRGRLSDHVTARAIPNLEDARLVARTSSTDTYSVAHSSESPTSSGLSSPMDAQSYDDIQSGEAVRRSMPNLAIMRTATTLRSNLAFPQSGTGQLRKNHYISDSRLSRIGMTDRPRLSVLAADSSHNSSYSRGSLASDTGRSRIADRNTSTPSLNRPVTAPAARVYSAQTLGSGNSRSGRIEPSTGRVQMPMGNVRSTGLHPPRFSSSSSSSISGIRPPRPTYSAQPGIRHSAAPGIPVPTFRSQSRIPAPGQLRFSRLPQSAASNRSTNPSRTSSMQKGPAVDDWRDGCY